MSGRLRGPRWSSARQPFIATIWDRNFLTRAPSYLFQSGLATASLFVILLIEDAMLRGAIVVAVASSAFIIFVIPNGVAATPQKVIGGHVVAVLGVMAALGLVIHTWSWSVVAFILVSAIVLSIIRMGLRPKLVNLL